MEAEDQSSGLSRFLSRLTVVFVTAWAIRALVVTGDAVLGEPFRHYLTTRPSATQAAAGTSFDQTLIKLDRAIPKNARVAVIWAEPKPEPDAVYYWSTYYLFPRSVTVAASHDPELDSRFDALIFVQAPDQALPELNGFNETSLYLYHDVTVVTYQRTSG